MLHTQSAASFFAHDRAAASLSDLDIVRKIVEREGCLEALAQLLATHARANQQDATVGAMATLTAAPMVLQSLLDQLRGVSVHVVEAIAAWRQRQGDDRKVFQWRSLNYQLKMLRDLDFLSLHRASVARLAAFDGLRLERNPFLAPLHLDHAALREPSPDAACRLALFVGSVDMRRIFAASLALLREEQQHQQQQTAVVAAAASSPACPPTPSSTTAKATVATRLHWSHRTMQLPLSSSAASLPSSDPRDAMAFDVELAKELVFQHEHELGALREELAVAQKKLHAEQFTLPPDRRRQLQTKIAALLHEIQRRTGDLFHRRNELHRKEAVLRMDKRRVARATEFSKALAQQHQSSEPASSTASSSSPVPASPRDAPPHFTATDAFKAALQADELRRHELIDQFATYNKLKASMSVTKRKLQSLALGSPQCRQGQRPASGTRSPSVWPLCSQDPVSAMSVEDVESFVNDLQIGDGYGSALRGKGIDGPLLAQATERDLEELGVPLRLHRVKIMQAVQQAAHSHSSY